MRFAIASPPMKCSRPEIEIDSPPVVEPARLLGLDHARLPAMVDVPTRAQRFHCRRL